jgi:hypothetical protein
MPPDAKFSITSWEMLYQFARPEALKGGCHTTAIGSSDYQPVGRALTAFKSQTKKFRTNIFGENLQTVA